ncbi:MAG: hypothetical protein C0467_25230 [Planctomycetaceae bacterium]|nr:hypothetical protein [Planctomycetaceae bacterium]
MLTFRLAAFFLLVPIAASMAHANSGASLALDIFRTQDRREELNEEVALCEHLEVVNREVLRRITIKQGLIAELIAGRATLAGVAEQFLVMNQSRPEYMVFIRSTCPGNSDYEKTAHNVIGYAGGELSRLSTVQQFGVWLRLQAELRGLDDSHTAATK